MPALSKDQLKEVVTLINETGDRNGQFFEAKARKMVSAAIEAERERLATILETCKPGGLEATLRTLLGVPNGGFASTSPSTRHSATSAADFVSRTFSPLSESETQPSENTERNARPRTRAGVFTPSPPPPSRCTRPLQARRRAASASRYRRFATDH